MRSRSFLYSTIAIVLALLLLTAGGLTWFFGQNPKRLLKSAYGGSPTATIFISSQAPLVASLLVSPEQVEAFQQTVASGGDRRSAGAELAQLKRGLLTAFDLNYEQDIQPWLGDELTFAVTTADLDRNVATGQQPGYLLVLTMKDLEKAGAFLELFWQKQSLAGVNLVLEQYQGVKLISGRSVVGELPAPPLPGDPNPVSINPALPRRFNLATATVGDRFLLLANHPKVLREAINTVQAVDLSLAHAPSYQQAVQDLTPDRIGFVFANWSQLQAWLKLNPVQATQSATRSNPQTAPSSSQLVVQAPIPQAELAIAIGLERQGIRLETLFFQDQLPQLEVSTEVGANNPSPLPALNQPVAAMAYIPAQSLFSLASQDLSRLWSTLETLQIQGGAIGQQFAQTLTQFQRQWGIDPQKDILNWVTGDYALAAIRHPDPQVLDKNAPIPVDWIFVAERSDNAPPAIEHLDDLAKQDGFSVGPLTIGQQQVSAWTKLTTNLKLGAPLNLQAQVRGVHTTIDRYELFTTSLEAMAEALQAGDNALVDNPDFQVATNFLPKPNGGYLYFNWPASEAILAQQLPVLNLLRLAGKPWLDPIRSFTFTPYQSTPATSDPSLSLNKPVLKGEFFIYLGKPTT